MSHKTGSSSSSAVDLVTQFYSQLGGQRTQRQISFYIFLFQTINCCRNWQISTSLTSSYLIIVSKISRISYGMVFQIIMQDNQYHIFLSHRNLHSKFLKLSLPSLVLCTYYLLYIYRTYINLSAFRAQVLYFEFGILLSIVDLKPHTPFYCLRSRDVTL